MDVIVTVDDRQVIVMFNTAAWAMFTCTAEQAIGLSMTRFIPERLHAQYLAYVENRRVPGDVSEVLDAVGIVVGLRLNGVEFPLELSYSNAIEASGTFHTLIIRDVTSRAQAYQALERSNLDLQQFAYVASHDLKTPLRSIGGLMQILERNHGEQLDDKARALIRRTADAPGGPKN